MDDVINFGQHFHFFQKKMLDHNKVHIHKKFQDLSRCQSEPRRYSMSLKDLPIE